MTAQTYTILTGAKTTLGSIKNWVNRSDIPVNFLIEEAQRYIELRVRDQQMVRETEITFKSGNGTTTEEDGSPTTVMIDSTATFNDGHVRVGTKINNVTDGSTATVSSITSASGLVTSALAGGSDNNWQSGDTYKIFNTNTLDVVQIMASLPVHPADGVEDTTGSHYLEPIRLRPNVTGIPVPYINERSMPDLRDTDGNLFTAETPNAFTFIDDSLRLDIDLTADLVCRHMFYKSQPLLSATHETNFLTNRHPTMFRYTIMAFAYEHMHDFDNFQYYMGRAEAMMHQLRVHQDMTRTGQEFPHGDPTEQSYYPY